MEGQYSGLDILEALENAHNYNDYLTRLVVHLEVIMRYLVSVVGV